MYNQEGKLCWQGSLDSYGRMRMERGETGSCPFRYQGQYEDKEIGLYYNRFRYYAPDEGMYISQDPISLAGGIKLYGYVHDTSGWVDVLGLSTYSVSNTRRTHILEGDPVGTGHGPNRGQIDAFPDTWTDDQSIAAIERVANSPSSTWKQVTGPGKVTAPITIGGPSPTAPTTTNKGTPVRFKVQGNDHGKTIEVIVEPGGEGIVTGYPKR